MNGGFQLKDFLPKDTLPTLSRSNILNAIWLTASGAHNNDSKERNSTNEINLLKATIKQKNPLTQYKN